MTDHEQDDTLSELAAAIREADRVSVLTGAGLSAASGIPTFRGDDGIWGDAFEEADFHVSRFRRDPAGFWVDRVALAERMRPPGGASPNPAHYALAALSDAGVLDGVITQNTDGLHAAAGTTEVIELHGTNARVECAQCGDTAAAGPVRERVRGGERPPTCDCGGVYKPAVVLFGEPLPAYAHRRARRHATESDVFLVAGSSLTVDPAASLPGLVDGELAVVNFEPTRYVDAADYTFRADLTDLLPSLAVRVLGEDADAVGPNKFSE